MSASGSVRTTGGTGGGASRRLMASPTAAATSSAPSARTTFAQYCQRMVLSCGSAPRRSSVRQRELHERLAAELVLLERERHIERRPVLGQVVVSFGCAPGDRAEDAAVLLERHL